MTAVHVHRRAVLAAAVASTGLVFLGLVFLERPGLGLAYFFFIPISVVAIVFGARAGLVAGVLAATLYTVAVVLNDQLPTANVLTISTPTRLLAYGLTGWLVGYFAQRNRDLIMELEVLVQRDRLTGLPNARGFEAAVDKRFAAEEPFAILLGDLDGLRELNSEDGHGEGDFLLARLAEALGRLVGPDEQIARVGGDEFAVLASVRSKDEAAERANRLQQRLSEQGFLVTFGWGVFPDEGSNALGLVRIADERLYARKLVRGRRLEDPPSPRALAG